MKRFNFKPLLHSVIYPLLGNLMSWYLKFVFKTSKVTIEIPEQTKPYFQEFAPAIYAFWHGRLLMMPTIHPKKYAMRILSSKNAVGIISENCVKNFGITLIRGSGRNPNKPYQDKGGARALREMLRCLKNNIPVGITPDGPLGPRFSINKGVLIASVISQKPIIPMSYSAKHGYIFNSWDKFLFPYPFTKLIFRLGVPIFPPQVNIHENISLLEQQLHKALMDDLNDIDILVKK